MDLREPFFAAEMQVAQFVLIETEQMQDGGVDVPEMAAVFYGVQADVIAAPTSLSAT